MTKCVTYRSTVAHSMHAQHGKKDCKREVKKTLGVLQFLSRSINCVFPALRCGPAGQGFAPGNRMFYGFEHMRLRYHSYMFDGSVWV
jgi:hypothetical protein